MNDLTVTQQNRIAQTACQRILKLVKSSRQRSIKGRQLGQDAATFELMLDKAEKTAQAVMFLVKRRYVEDAFVLARSLVNLVIDVSYLSTKDADRFISYRATGLVAQRRMAEQAGFPQPDETTIYWKDVKARAKRWQRPGALYERAQKAECLLLYERAYRHGSSYEHSDAWSLLTYKTGQARSRGHRL